MSVVTVGMLVVAFQREPTTEWMLTAGAMFLIAFALAVTLAIREARARRK